MPEWEYVPDGWARHIDLGTIGWNRQAVAEAYRRKWPSFLDALESGVLGIDHEVPAGRPISSNDLAAHNTLLTFGYVLARASRGKNKISILDWGGAVGHYYLIGKALMPEIELLYECKEVPEVCSVGRELLPEAQFHDNDECLEKTYDFVFASSSLQYAEDWRKDLHALASATRDYLYVTRLPVAVHADSFVVLQRAQAYGYETEYLGWVLNRDALLEEAALAGVECAREFIVTGGFEAEGAPESPVYDRGFLFRVKQTDHSLRSGSGG